MTTDSNREAFEKWLCDYADMSAEEVARHRYDCGYAMHIIDWADEAYAAWQAATAHNKERLREVADKLNSAYDFYLKECFDLEGAGEVVEKVARPSFNDLCEAIATLNDMIGE